MKISRENYEIFFIDYLDGTLSDQQINELEDFLLGNPDLREELEGMEKTMLVPCDLSFNDKDLLKKTDTESPLSEENFNDYSVAYIEGDLSLEESAAFESYLENHPQYKKDIELYKKTFLAPDHTIILQNKNKLKKRLPLKRHKYLYPFFSAAAAIALLLIILLRTETSKNLSLPITGSVETEETENISPSVKSEVQDILTHDLTLAGKVKPAIRTVIDAEQSVSKFNVHKEEEMDDDLLLPESGNYVISYSAVTLPPVNIGKVSPDVIQTFKTDPGIPAVTEEKYMSLSEIALEYVNDKVLKQEIPVTDPSRLSLWDVADAGVRGINRITGSEMKLDKVTRDNGDVALVSFEAGFFGFTRTIR